jgi:hypothetical protein
VTASGSGLTPKNKDVDLTKGGDYIHAMRRRLDGVITDWPVGTEWSILFDDNQNSVWDADVDGELASWNVDKAVADAMPPGTTVRWRRVNGTTDLIYYVGRVNRGELA